MKTITVHKAGAIGDQYIESTTIQMATPFPEFKTPDENDNALNADAVTLEQALINTLPGGVYDRLFALMAERKASHLRVKHAPEPEPESDNTDNSNFR